MAQLKALMVKDNIEYVVLSQYVTAYLEDGFTLVEGSYTPYTPLVGTILEDDVVETVTNKKFSATDKAKLDELHDALTDGILVVNGIVALGTVVPPVTVASVSSPIAVEGTNLVFAVALSDITTTELILPFTTGGTATAGIDYITPLVAVGATISGSNIVVQAGTTNFTVRTLVSNDLIFDVAETLVLTVGGVTGTGTITDVLPPAPPPAIPTTGVLRGDNIAGIQYYANGGMLINQLHSSTRPEGPGVTVDQITGSFTLAPGQQADVLVRLLVDPNVGYIPPGPQEFVSNTAATLSVLSPVTPHRIANMVAGVGLCTWTVTDEPIGSALNTYHLIARYTNNTASPILVTGVGDALYAVSDKADHLAGYLTRKAWRDRKQFSYVARMMSQLPINGFGIDDFSELYPESNRIWHNGQNGGNAHFPYTAFAKVCIELAVYHGRPQIMWLNFPTGSQLIQYSTDATSNRMTIVNQGGDLDLAEGERVFLLVNGAGTTGFPADNTFYYARNVVGSTCQFSTTVSGALVNLTTTTIQQNNYSSIYSAADNQAFLNALANQVVNTTHVLNGTTYAVTNQNIISEILCEAANEIWHPSGPFFHNFAYAFGPAAVLAGGVVGETHRGAAFMFKKMVNAMAQTGLARSRYKNVYGVQSHNVAGLGAGLLLTDPESTQPYHTFCDLVAGGLYLTPLDLDGTRVMEAAIGAAGFKAQLLLDRFENKTFAEIAPYFERSLNDEAAIMRAMKTYVNGINPAIGLTLYEEGDDFFLQQSYDSVTVTVGVSSGTFTAIATGGVTITNNSTATVTLVGSIANIRAALNGASHNNTANLNGNINITLTTNITPFNNVEVAQYTAASGGAPRVFNTANGNSLSALVYVFSPTLKTRLSTMANNVREFILNSAEMNALRTSLIFVLLETGVKHFMNFGDFGEIVTTVTDTNYQLISWSAGLTPDTPRTNKEIFLDNLANYTLSSGIVSTVATPSATNEGSTMAFAVTIASGSPSTRYIQFSIGGSASPNTDYSVVSASAGVSVAGFIVAISANITNFNLNVTTLNDAVFEYNETIILNIDGVSATGIINFNDGATSGAPTFLDFTNLLGLVAANQTGGITPNTLLSPTEVRFNHSAVSKAGEINISSLVNTLANGATATIKVSFKTSYKATMADLYATSARLYVRNTGAYVSGSGAGNNLGQALEVVAIRSKANVAHVSSNFLLPKGYMADTGYVDFEMDIKNFAGRDLTVADTAHLLLVYGSGDTYDFFVKEMYR